MANQFLQPYFRVEPAVNHIYKDVNKYKKRRNNNYRTHNNR